MNIHPTSIARDLLPQAVDTLQRLLASACDPAIYYILDAVDGEHSAFGWLRLTTEIHHDGGVRASVWLVPPQVFVVLDGAKPLNLIVSSGELDPPDEKAHAWILADARDVWERRAKGGNQTPPWLPYAAQPDDLLTAILAPYATAAKLAAGRMLVGIETQQPQIAKTADALVAAGNATFVLDADILTRFPSVVRLSLAPTRPAVGNPVLLAVLGAGDQKRSMDKPTPEQKAGAAWFWDAMALLNVEGATA